MLKKTMIIIMIFSYGPVLRGAQSRLQDCIDVVCDASTYDEKMLSTLLNRQEIDLSLVNNNGLRALDIVLRNCLWSCKDRIRALELLVQHKAPLVYPKGTSTPLHYVVMWFAALLNHNDFVVLVNYLLRQGADLNAQDEQGDTPLHIAFYNKDISTVKYLLNCGASPMIKNIQGKTFFDLLTYRKDAFSDAVMFYFAQRMSH